MSDDQETIAQPTDAELFSGAIAPEPKEAPASQDQQPAEQQAEQATDGQPRDERGRFAGKDQAQDAPAAATQQQQPDPSQQQAQDTEAAVPSWRLRELREQREAAERRAQESERRSAALEQQLRELNAWRRQQTEKPQEPVDFYANPDGYLDQRLTPLRQEFGQQLGQTREGISNLIAVDKYGEDVVQAAYEEMEKQYRMGTARYDYARIMQSVHPFGELVKWHKQQLNRQKVGDDPDAWFEKQLEEKLKDQQFQGKLVERIRGTAQTNGAQPGANGGRPNVQLPPSLNKVAAASRPTDDTAGDMSDASLFRHATAR